MTYPVAPAARTLCTRGPLEYMDSMITLTFGLSLDHMPHRLDPVHSRHADIHDHDVGGNLAGHLDGLPAVDGLAHDLHARFGIDQPPKTVPEHLVIVNDHHPGHSCDSFSEALLHPSARSVCDFIHVYSDYRIMRRKDIREIP